MRVYGPYTRKDGRAHVILIYPDGRRRTVSYPKYLMEQYLGYELGPNETVDHIDENFRNNSLSNLRLKTLNDHIFDDIRRAVLEEIVCVLCGAKAYKEPSNLRGNSKQGKAGPFCGKSCAGKYGSMIQNGANRLPVQPSPSKTEYFKMR